jgi:hypothetical protein
MDADRLLTMIHDECAKSPEGRANRAPLSAGLGQGSRMLSLR